MTDREALLRGVIANPAEDTPRLAYADWLDEHTTDAVDRDRAWLIRFQCDPQNGRIHDGEREYATVERHAATWFALAALSGRKHNRHLRDWYAADHGPPNLRLRLRGNPVRIDDWVELPIRRGFVDAAVGPGDWWAGRGDLLRAAHPLTTVRLTRVPRLAGGEDAVGLHVDPTGRRFAWVDVRAEASARTRHDRAPGRHSACGVRAALDGRGVRVLAMNAPYPGATSALPPEPVSR